MIQVYEPEFTEDDVAAVSDVLRSGWVNEHSLTKRFEEGFARLVGSKYAVATTSGTTALFMALRAAGVTVGDGVAVPDYTAIGTVRAIQLTGASVVLVDVDDEGNIDVEKAVESNVSHVVAVHNNGYPCRIGELADYFGEECVIEDACQSIGSKSVHRQLGTFTRFGCFSLATTKIVTAGQGGVVVTDDEKAYVRLQRLKNQGNYRGVDAPDTYLGEGYNLKWTEMNAALALSQMSRLPQRIKRMNEIVELYHENGVYPMPGAEILPWRITASTRANRRGSLIKALREKGINAQPFPAPIHFHYPVGLFPNAERYASEGFYLPSSFTLKDDEVQYVCDTFKEAMK